MTRPAAAAALIGALFAAPLSARAAPAPGASDPVSPFVYYYIDVYKPYFAEGKGPFGRPARWTRRPIGRKTQIFDVEKPEGTLRVFFLGGSVAQTYDFEDESKGVRLDKALEAMLPGRDVEIINAGQTGYDSARVRIVFDEIMEYSPDLVVLMTAVNDDGRPLLPRWLASLCSRDSLTGPCERRVSRLLTNRISPDAVQENFERNILYMIRKAKARKVPVVVATLPVCLRDMPPTGVLPLTSTPFFRAWTAFEARDWKKAEAGFRAFRKVDADNPLAAYYIARSLDKQGRYAEALRYYKLSQNLDRAVPRRNDFLRKAAEEEGVVLADLQKTFERVSEHGLTGRRTFEDDVHWWVEMDPLVTITFARALHDGAKAGRPSVAPPSKWVSTWLKKNEAPVLAKAREAKLTRAQSWRMFRYRMWEPLRERRYLFSERVIALLETVRAANPELLKDSRRLRGWLRAKLKGSLWKNEGPEHMDAWWPMMLAHIGELYRRMGEHKTAVVYFGDALELEPGLDRARRRRALSHLELGDRGKAAADIAKTGRWWVDPETVLWIEHYKLTPDEIKAAL